MQWCVKYVMLDRVSTALYCIWHIAKDTQNLYTHSHAHAHSHTRVTRTYARQTYMFHAECDVFEMSALLYHNIGIAILSLSLSPTFHCFILTLS